MSKQNLPAIHVYPCSKADLVRNSECEGACNGWVASCRRGDGKLITPRLSFVRRVIDTRTVQNVADAFARRALFDFCHLIGAERNGSLVWGVGNGERWGDRAAIGRIKSCPDVHSRWTFCDNRRATR